MQDGDKSTMALAGIEGAEIVAALDAIEIEGEVGSEAHGQEIARDRLEVKRRRPARRCAQRWGDVLAGHPPRRGVTVR